MGNNSTAQWQAKLNIEKGAKNKAYAFIIAAGLLNEFMAFNKALEGTEDYQKLAVRLLAKEAKNK